MGLLDEIQSEIGEAFDDDLADVVKTFTGSYATQTGFNPVTENAETVTTTYNGRGVLSAYSLDRVDGVNILRGDIKLLALTNEVTDRPAVEHVITAPDLVTGNPQQYTVISLNTDPASAAWVMQLRRS